MDIQAIINRKLAREGAGFSPVYGQTVFANDDPGSRSTWLDTTSPR